MKKFLMLIVLLMSASRAYAGDRQDLYFPNVVDPGGETLCMGSPRGCAHGGHPQRPPVVIVPRSLHHRPPPPSVYYAPHYVPVPQRVCRMVTTWAHQNGESWPVETHEECKYQ